MKWFFSFYLTVLIGCSSTIDRVKEKKPDGSSSLMIVKIIEMERIDTFSVENFTRRPRDPNVDYIVLSVFIQNAGQEKITVSAKPKIKLPSDQADSREAIRAENCCTFLETAKANLAQLPRLFSNEALLIFESFEITPDQSALKTFYFPFPRNLSPKEFIFKAKLANDSSYQEIIADYNEVP